MWVVGDNLWISVDNLLVRLGGYWGSRKAHGLPTINSQGYTHKKGGKVDRKAVLNCGFLSYPQEYLLVTTNSSIDIQHVVREPLAFQKKKNELGLQI
jgi:hypothetical protein